MEYLYFPKKNYYLTQGFGNNTYSHNQRFAIDVSAKGGDNKIYAPFSGYFGYVFAKKGYSYSAMLVSDQKIMCADGNMYYVVMLITHPKEIKNYKVGDKFKQGDLIATDGNTGNATGKHLDLEIAIYKNKNDIKLSLKKISTNNYGLINAVDITKYMFLKKDSLVINDIYNNKKFSFKKEDELKLYTTGTYITLYVMKIRKGPSKTYSQKTVRQLSKDGQKNATSKNLNAKACYKKGTKFDALEIVYNSNNDIWAKGYSGYINIVDGNNVNCQKL